MTRRGKCHCGTILQFQRTSQGYKTRCPKCSAVVRLRDGEKSPPGAKKKPSAALTGSSRRASPPPLPTEQTGVATDDLLPDDPAEMTLAANQEPAPAEIEAYGEEEEQGTSWLTWVLFAVLAAAVVGGVGAAAMWWR